MQDGPANADWLESPAFRCSGPANGYEKLSASAQIDVGSTTFVYAFEGLNLLGGRAYFYMRPLHSCAEGLGGLLDGSSP